MIDLVKFYEILLVKLPEVASLQKKEKSYWKFTEFSALVIFLQHLR